MKINDPVYGEIEIDEPLILELINSEPLQRLKGIDQGGYTKPFHKSEEIFYRFDHSVGVYWLLKKYGAPLAEQAAGLIHDVSHSAFSHCIDYVLENGNGGEQSYQDNLFPAFVRRSIIPEIIKKYNLETEYLIADNNFPLKERPLPDLCADRIDYSLRTAVTYGHLSRDEAQKILNELIIKDGYWVFKNLAAAENYARLFKDLNDRHYASFSGAIMHLTVGNYLRYALEHNYIIEADLYTTDDAVLSKIAKHLEIDQQLRELFKQMNSPANFENKPAGEGQFIQLKSRIVDPLLLNNNQVVRLTTLKPDWQPVIEAELIPKSYCLKFKN